MIEKKFYNMNKIERLNYLKKTLNLSDKDISTIQDPLSTFSFENANHMIENAIGIFTVPLGIAMNFMINNKEYLIPMATEEPSVIAAASKSGKNCKTYGRICGRDT